MPTTSLILSVADAIVADLNSRTYSPALTASRTYLPEYEIDDLATLRVDVVPRGPRTISTLSRGTRQQDFVVDVVAQQRVDVSGNTDGDELMALVDSIIATFQAGYVAVGSRVESVSQDELFDEELMVKDSVFRSVISISFRVFGGEPTPPTINEPD